MLVSTRSSTKSVQGVFRGCGPRAEVRLAATRRRFAASIRVALFAGQALGCRAITAGLAEVPGRYARARQSPGAVSMGQYDGARRHGGRARGTGRMGPRGGAAPPYPEGLPQAPPCPEGASTAPPLFTSPASHALYPMRAAVKRPTPQREPTWKT